MLDSLSCETSKLDQGAPLRTICPHKVGSEVIQIWSSAIALRLHYLFPSHLCVVPQQKQQHHHANDPKHEVVIFLVAHDHLEFVGTS